MRALLTLGDATQCLSLVEAIRRDGDVKDANAVYAVYGYDMGYDARCWALAAQACAEAGMGAEEQQLRGEISEAQMRKKALTNPQPGISIKPITPFFLC
jgi:hypothetical protein